MSDRRPLVGITCGSIGSDLPRYGVNRRYVVALLEAGADPLLLPPGTSTAVLERLDGLVLPGGGDLDPCHYGQQMAGSALPLDTARDQLELDLLREALGKKPVLAICRGLQVVNVAAGGTLVQHVDDHKQQGDRGALSHDVKLLGASRFRDAVQADAVRVNSLHHQAVGVLGAGLRATAVAADGVVEGLEDEAGTVVAVQCHPEELTRLDWARRLFAGFVSSTAADRPPERPRLAIS